MRCFLLLLACAFSAAFHATPLRPAVQAVSTPAAASIQVRSPRKQQPSMMREEIMRRKHLLSFCRSPSA